MSKDNNNKNYPEIHAGRKRMLSAQRNEISEYETFRWLSKRIKNGKNKKVLEQIAEEEFNHYKTFRHFTGRDVRPRRLRVFLFKLISRALGLSFGLTLLERSTQRIYTKMESELPELADIIEEEHRHEKDILELINEEHIDYAGSIVLGLNDALVELTGALAGLTFALQNSNTIAMAGFITGVAASMSMAASELLSAREEADKYDYKNPLKSAVYTGVTYLIIVLVLILPYLLISNVYFALMIMIVLSVIIILIYNFYIAVAKGLKMWRRFGEMVGISLTVAIISFLIGIAARSLFGVNI